MTEISLPVARVYVDLGLPHLDRPFDYAVPPEMDQTAVVGSRVRVRFAGRIVSGFVVERVAVSQQESLAPLARSVSAEPVLPPVSAALVRAVADHYGGTFSDVVRLAVPPRHASTETAPVHPRRNGRRRRSSLGRSGGIRRARLSWLGCGPVVRRGLPGRWSRLRRRSGTGPAGSRRPRSRPWPQAVARWWSSRTPATSPAWRQWWRLGSERPGWCGRRPNWEPRPATVPSCAACADRRGLWSGPGRRSSRRWSIWGCCASGMTGTICTPSSGHRTRMPAMWRRSAAT